MIQPHGFSRVIRIALLSFLIFPVPSVAGAHLKEIRAAGGDAEVIQAIPQATPPAS